MKFLVDAQLPRRMTKWLRDGGQDAIHTLDLPLANATPDDEVRRICDADQRVLVTKDGDFVDSHLLAGRPAKLLLISTGNITNPDLESLMSTQIPVIVAEFAAASFIELTRIGLVVRG